MNSAFWIEIQKCWRITTSNKDKEAIQETASRIAEDWGTARIIKPYSPNPLDEFEDDDDDY